MRSCLALLTMWVMGAGSLAAEESESQRVARYLEYRTLPRLTSERIDIEGPVRGMCIDPRMHHGPHLVPGIHLYAAKAVIEARAKSEEPRYPVGAVLVKEKFDGKEDATPSIITVMEKIANAGTVDDWRFTMVRVSDRSVVKEGFSVSCVNCHSRYATSDYVSRVTDKILAGLGQKKPAHSVK